MKLTAVVAVAENNVIGRKGQLPWHISSDLKMFKKLTSGGIVIMGRKSYESIGKPLLHRINIVVTRQQNFTADEVIVSTSVEEAIAKANSLNHREAFIIGGAEIFHSSYNYWDKIYFSRVHLHPEGDTFFTDINWLEWVKIKEEFIEAGSNDDAAFTFREFHRRIEKTR